MRDVRSGGAAALVFPRVVLASNNAGKLREFHRLLAPLGIEVIAQSDLGIPEADEPHPTFVENALAKARNASARAKLPALADDSGICVRALAGAPGVQSARYAGEPKSDARNNAKLIAALDGIADRRAHYACVLALLRHEHDPEPIVAEGTWHGTIVDAPRGTGGFGYDPHFLDAATGLTAAELPLERKNELSHRGKAIRALIARLAALAPATRRNATAMAAATADAARAPVRIDAAALSGPRFAALPPLALYVHIPWCLRKCPYCDFNSHEASGERAGSGLRRCARRRPRARAAVDLGPPRRLGVHRRRHAEPFLRRGDRSAARRRSARACRWSPAPR